MEEPKQKTEYDSLSPAQKALVDDKIYQNSVELKKKIKPDSAYKSYLAINDYPEFEKKEKERLSDPQIVESLEQEHKNYVDRITKKPAARQL